MLPVALIGAALAQAQPVPSTAPFKTTELTDDQRAADIVMTVADPGVITLGQLLSVDKEMELVTAISNRVVSVIRAIDGTAATPHSRGSKITIGDLSANGRQNIGGTILPRLASSIYYEQAGDGAVPQSQLAFNRERLSVTQFGADPSGAVDSLPAFRAADRAAGQVGTVYVPSGAYSINGSLTLSGFSRHLICAPGTTIRYTGASRITAVIQIGDGKPNFHSSIESCTVVGSPGITSYAVYGRQLSHATLSNLILHGADTCLGLYDGNANHVIAPLCSGAYAGGVPHPASTGVLLLDEFNTTVSMMRLEEIAGSGLKLAHGSGVACGGNLIQGGTSEGNSIGIEVANCGSNTFIGVDMEANTGVAVVDNSWGNMYFNVSGENIHFTSSARNSEFHGGNVSSIRIDEGAAGVRIIGVSYSNNGGAITDNGLRTTLLSNRSANGGAFQQDQIVGLKVNGDWTKIGIAAPSPVGSNSVVMGVEGVTRLSFNTQAKGLTMTSSPNICDEAPESADNALVVNLLDANGERVRVSSGLRIQIYLTHRLGASGSNTLNLNGSGPAPVHSHTGLSGIGKAYAPGGVIELLYTSRAWLDMSQ